MKTFGEERKSHIEIGEIYFWTATIRNWEKLLEEKSYKEIIVGSLDYLSCKKMIDVFGFVIMPNHLHFIWRILQMNGKEMPHASFLKYTSHLFKKKLVFSNHRELDKYSVNAPNKDYEFWKRDSLAIELYDQEIAYQKLDYIHANPVSGKWQLVKDPTDYKYSSAKFYEFGIKEFSFIKDLREEY